MIIDMCLSAQSLEKVAQSVVDIISQKTEQKVHISDNDNINKEIADMLKYVHMLV